MTTGSLADQLEPGEVVLAGEAELYRVIAELEPDGRLRIHRERWSLPDSSYPDGCWHHDQDWGVTLESEAVRMLSQMLLRAAIMNASERVTGA